MVTRELIERLRRAAACCPWRAGQPAPLLTEAASALQGKNEEIARLEGELAQTAPNPNHGGPLPLTTDAAPSAPGFTQPLRLCGLCQMWNSKPCGEGCGFSLRDPTWESQTSAQSQPLEQS